MADGSTENVLDGPPRSARRSTRLASRCPSGLCGNITYSAGGNEQIPFRGRGLKGGVVTTGSGTPGADAYRVFVQGTTGFVSIQSVRDDAEQRAKEFCARKHQTMESLAETTAKPPHILGNFPRVEIVFDCVAVPDAQPAIAGDDSRYIQLRNLKKLLDGGIQVEFDQEKAKILAQPMRNAPHAPE